MTFVPPPLHEPPLFDWTLGELLHQTALKFPDQDAVVYVDRDYRLTWRQFDALTDELAKGLMALGIEKGEKVAVWATNVPFWIALMFATAKMGAILLTVNTAYKRNELKYLMTNSEAENIFIINGFRDSDYIEILYDLAPELRTMQRGATREQARGQGLLGYHSTAWARARNSPR